MTPYYTDDAVTLYHGDCLDVLAELPDASVDSVCTDPPYGLANTNPEQVADTIVKWVNGDRDYLPGGAGFMGKSWDAFVPPVAVWDECLRVLKPGGHVLAFAGARTVDLMTLGLRLAGFEIRDSIAWLYGSGFPKSLDVSKAIDKRRDWSLVERLSGEIRRARAEAGLSLAEIGQATLDATDGTYGKWYHRGGHMFFETGRSLPSRPEWEHLRHVLPIAPEFVEVYDEAEREVIAERRVTDRRGDGTVVGLGHAGNADITAPATPDAKRWQGWGTALKPAFEPIVVGRKPLAGTVAENVLTHGTGALNIDGCRVGDGSDSQGARPMHEGSAAARYTDQGGTNFAATPGPRGGSPAGRWPTNVVLDDTQAAELDRQSGILTSGKMQPTHTTAGRSVYGQNADGGYTTMETYGDSGGASRFFPVFRYEAKAPTSERPRDGQVAHPTVKPLDLMRWLVRLVTPHGGTVLEPFAGSGTTAEACVLERFQCIAIEREADYLPLITQRLTKPLELGFDLEGLPA